MIAFNAGLSRSHTTAKPQSLDFTVPPHLEASEPPEARGLTRDDVRLMVSSDCDDCIEHTRFHHLPAYLQAGDVLVINTSATMNAALPATRSDGKQLELHLSTRLPADQWIVEVREPAPQATAPFLTANAGETLSLPQGETATLHTPYYAANRHKDAPNRLWIATITCSTDTIYDYLAQYGHPIRYNYVKDAWPIEMYQTVYANEVGSAEMPSAGRAFTPELIMRLVAKGVQVVPLVLHTGVASLEKDEPPYEEYYRVPPTTAHVINAANQDHKRVVAVGTTVIRALETVADASGIVHPGDGWTHLIITPQRPIRAVNAMITGLHEPEATHLSMLQALAGPAHIARAYHAALKNDYLWHEFGDLHLILA